MWRSPCRYGDLPDIALARVPPLWDLPDAGVGWDCQVQPAAVGPGTPVPVAASVAKGPPATGGTDPAVAAALANGVGMMFGGMKPIQK